MDRKEIINRVGQCIARINGMSASCYILYAENSTLGLDLHIWGKEETTLIDAVEYALDVTVPSIPGLWNKTLGAFVDSFADQLIHTSNDWCPPAEMIPPDDSEMKDAPFAIENLRMNRRKDKSFYVIKFEIDQRDADNITVSTSPIEGFPTKTELARLCVMANYRDLECYDGAWWHMDKIRDALDKYLEGSFYETCNRFKIEDIYVWGYDANTKSFYDMDLPEPDQLGMTLDEAYESLFNTDE